MASSALAVHNLADLEDLNEETLLERLSERHGRDQIYTYVGEILVTINPYKWIDNLYSADRMDRYANLSSRSDAEPHIFAVASSAFSAMRRDRANQVCVISGESGAGKTEAAKLFVKQLVGNHSHQAPVERRLLEVNPLIEAFGNATTGLNNNSSRFGKFTRIDFDENGAVAGAEMARYLLEKSRVARQAPGEQNFHVFGYLLAGPGAAALGLGGGHAYMPSREQTGPDGRSLDEMRVELDAAFQAVGFTPAQMDDLYRVLAAILHLGDIDFCADAQDAAAVADARALAAAAEQLAVDESALELALTRSIIVARGAEVERLHKPHEAEDCRDALAKALYDRSFGWIVEQCNVLLRGHGGATANDLSIGILDIFGFENFDTNAFEQLLINLTNEQLQWYFNEHIFAMELAEYAKEGIDGSTISYTSNEPLLNMILNAKPPLGMLAIIDEEANFPKATDATLVAKLHAAFEDRGGQYDRPRGDAPQFTISHYAGDVEYQAVGFLETNRDTLSVDVVGALALSDNGLIRALVDGDRPAGRQEAGHGKRRAGAGRSDAAAAKRRLAKSIKGVRAAAARRPARTVAARFKLSLNDLMAKLAASAPHFVRCIKPNLEQAAGLVDRQLVTKQLRYTGMLEATRIRREGYAVRLPFATFVQRYRVLGAPGRAEDAAACRGILAKAGVTDFAVGRTKIFLRYTASEQLNAMLAPLAAAQVTIARHVRGHLARRRVAKLREEAQRRTRDEKVMTAKQKKRQATIKWVQETQAEQVKNPQGEFEDWFWGIVSRKAAEAELSGHQDGTFLIRVAESRLGYSLSCCVQGAVKHYKVTCTEEGQFTIDGTERWHGSLAAMVSTHATIPVSPAQDLLLQACPRSSGRDDLDELE